MLGIHGKRQISRIYSQGHRKVQLDVVGTIEGVLGHNFKVGIKACIKVKRVTGAPRELFTKLYCKTRRNGRP